MIEIWTSNTGVPADTGVQFAELNAYLPATLYQVINTEPGSTIVIALAHRGRFGTDVMQLQVGPNLTNNVVVPDGPFANVTG